MVTKRIIRSIRNLENNLKKTRLTVESFISCSAAAIAFERILTANNKHAFDKDKIGKLIKKHLDHTKVSMEDLYEMGFIKIFADFESFMYEFLLEKYLKNPAILDKNKNIEASIIWDSKSIIDLRKNIVDSAAVADSWNIEVWENVIKNKFKISIFADSRERELFLTLNEIRNAYMHSGGKASAKTIQKLRLINSEFVKRGEKINFKKSELFNWSYNAIQMIVNRLKV